MGAEADNIVTANFLLAKISDSPLKANGKMIENVKPTLKAEDFKIHLEGVNVVKLYATSILKPYREKKHFQLYSTKF